MSPRELLVLDSATVLVIAALVGLAARGRLGACWSFSAYLGSVAAWNLGERLAPEIFWTHEAWTIMTAWYALLRVAVAVELALRILPRRAALAVAAGSFALLLAILGPGATYLDTLGAAVPRLQLAGLWSVVLVALAARGLLTPFHRDVLLGFALYLAASAPLHAAAGLGAGPLPAYDWIAALDPIIYLATVGIWIRAAWRPVEAPATEGLAWPTMH